MINNNRTSQAALGGDADSKNEGDVDSMDVDEVRGRGDVNPSTTFNRNQGNLKKPASVPPLALGADADGAGAPRLPGALRKEIDKMLDQKMAEIKHGVAMKMHNIHLDLIRSMVQQEGQIEDCLQAAAARNKEQKQIIKQLKMENEQLRKI